MNRTFEPGAILAERYRVERLVGQGGMASVYLAMDQKLGHEIAIKVLFDHFRTHPVVCARFEQEVVAARKIVHPSVIRIFDLVDVEAALFLTMEYVAGHDGKYVLREEGRLQPERAVQIAARVAEGLEHAHRAGVVHGDIKPHNVLIGDQDAIKIVDFGMARVNTIAGLTAHSLVLGTPEYAAPELFTNRYMDARADVYSLGALLFELVVGRPPFRGKTPYEVIHAKSETPPSAQAAHDGVPDWLDAVIARAMAAAPEDRYQSAAAFKEALEARTADRLPVLASDADRCKHCRAPMVTAFPFCFACGRDSSFIRQSAKGRHMVMVSRKWRFRLTQRDGGADVLTYDQKYHIVERVKQAVGKAQDDGYLVDNRLRYPPFVAIDRLSRADADKLRDDLEAHDIPARVIERDGFTLLRYLWRNPSAIFAMAVVTISMASVIAAMTAMKAFEAMPVFLGFFAVTLGLGVVWQKVLMKPLSDILTSQRMWWGGRRKLAAADPLALADEDRAAVAWLVPLARAMRGRIHGKGLMGTLNRLIRRAVELERTLRRIDWLSAKGQEGYRRQLKAALERATEIAGSIQQADDFLSDTDEGEVFESIEHCARRLIEPGADGDEISALKAQQEGILATRDRIEQDRGRHYAALLRLVTSLDALHARLAQVAQAEGDSASTDLDEALEELETELEGIAEVGEADTA